MVGQDDVLNIPVTDGIFTVEPDFGAGIFVGCFPEKQNAGGSS